MCDYECVCVVLRMQYKTICLLVSINFNCCRCYSVHSLQYQIWVNNVRVHIGVTCVWMYVVRFTHTYFTYYCFFFFHLFLDDITLFFSDFIHFHQYLTSAFYAYVISIFESKFRQQQLHTQYATITLRGKEMVFNELFVRNECIVAVAVTLRSECSGHYKDRE